MTPPLQPCVLVLWIVAALEVMQGIQHTTSESGQSSQKENEEKKGKNPVFFPCPSRKKLKLQLSAVRPLVRHDAPDPPQYFIVGGLVFVPLTESLLMDDFGVLD